jgi:hypothetical protein
VTNNGFSKEQVPVEELESAGEATKGSPSAWTEEMTVAADRLVDTVKTLAREANVRRIVIKNRDDKVLINVPLWLGLGGIVWLPFYSALAVMAALATEHKILVERVPDA